MSHPLRQYREDQKLSLRALAEALGVTEAQMSRIEHGKRRCTPAMAIKIEEFTEGGMPRWQLRPDLWSEPELSGAAA